MMRKITLGLPKGSQFEMAVRRYVTTAIERRDAEVSTLGRIEIIAEYETALKTGGRRR